MMIWPNPFPPYDGTLTVWAPPSPEASYDIWTFRKGMKISSRKLNFFDNNLREKVSFRVRIYPQF